jgi:hypothetical protein
VQRVVLPGHRVSLLVDRDAIVEFATEAHGAYVRDVASGLTLHVRDWWRAERLMDQLHDQNWARPLTMIVERRVGSLDVVGGTFVYGPDGQFVREWFASDGIRAANAALLFTQPIAAGVLDRFERLIDSIELLTSPR